MRHRLAIATAAAGAVLCTGALAIASTPATAVTSAVVGGWGNKASAATASTTTTSSAPATSITKPCVAGPRGSSSTRSLGTSKIDDSIPLYLDQQSGVCGDTLVIRAGSQQRVTTVIRAYRVGWYAGAGSRLIWSSSPISLPSTHFPTKSRPTIPSPNWPVAAKVRIDSSWKPGLYVIATTTGGRITGVAEFVVRNATAANRAVVIYSGLTNASYSPFGGASLYRALYSGPLATSVALQRPLILNGRGAFMKYDVPTAQVLDRIGIDLDSVMDTDVDRSPSLLSHRTEIVLPGHSEYWTKAMYDATLAAQRAGTNITVLGANEIYWQTRVQTNTQGQPASMFVARQLALDPLAATKPALATVRWRDTPLVDDPSEHLGESYTVTRAHGSLQILSVPTWLSKVPGLNAGAILANVAAGEVDGPQVSSSMPIPSNTQVIGLGLLRGANGKTATAGMTYYTSPSGSASFQFGTTNWTCQLMASCPDGITSASTRATQWALTTSVVRALLQRGWGASHPSKPNSVHTLSAMHSVLSPAAYGTYGLGD